MIIPHSPASIQETRLFKIIEESEPRHGLLSLANTFIEIANPIVDSISSGPFKNYTLHNRDHIKKVFHLGGFIISEKTIGLLSPAECLIFLYASYLHDMGMAITADEVNGYLVDSKFKESLEAWPEMNEAIQRTRDLLTTANSEGLTMLAKDLTDLQNAALANFLRPLHATQGRYKALIKLMKSGSGLNNLFEINGQNFESELISICESHNQNAAVLGEILSAHEDKFPRSTPIGGFEINTQFIAAMLRLSDILDFDFERTPKVLFESLGIKHSSIPGAEVSLFEWQKHISVHTIEITRDEVVISGNCKHPIIESGIRDFCQIIEHEIHDTSAVLKRNTSEIQEKYQIILPHVVRANLRSEGYVYMNLSLKLDEAAIMTLLMGNQLYNSRLVSIRELIQNAVDACLVRASLLREPGYDPKISIYAERKQGDNSTWLIIRDNGIGMDDHVLKDHFFRVGSSYYKSPEYLRLFKTLNAAPPPITSRFGIGFISTFMLGSQIEISTRKIYPGGGNSRGVRIFIERMGALAYVQEDDSIESGTIIKVKIGENLDSIDLDTIESFIQYNILRPLVPVEIAFGSKRETISSDNFYFARVSSRAMLPENRLKILSIDLNKACGISGRIIFIVYEREDGKLSNRGASRNIEITTSSPEHASLKVNPSLIVENFEGNRVTVGGFKMSFSNIGKLFRGKRNRMAFIFDLDFLPSESLEFNVSRTKIVDKSLAVRNRLRIAILEKLREQGYFDLFDEETKSLLEGSQERDPFDASKEQLRLRFDAAKRAGLVDVNDELLDKIEAILPKSAWPKNIHHQIAQSLTISRGMAYTAISALIVNGRVKNPNYNNHSA